MEKFIIRGYLNEDASKIGQYDFLAALTYQYKQDVKPENIVALYQAARKYGKYQK